jgi:hypothetical protein
VTTNPDEIRRLKELGYLEHVPPHHIAPFGGPGVDTPAEREQVEAWFSRYPDGTMATSRGAVTSLAHFDRLGVDTPSPEPLRCPRDGETFDQHYEIGRRDGLAEAIAECDECAHRLAAHADGGCLVCSCRVPWRPEGVGGV